MVKMIILAILVLKPSIQDGVVSIEGLTTFQSDRSSSLISKSWGSGVCIYTTNNWCNIGELVSSYCSPDVELLTVKCRPFYLPQN